MGDVALLFRCSQGSCEQAFARLYVLMRVSHSFAIDIVPTIKGCLDGKGEGRICGILASERRFL